MKIFTAIFIWLTIFIVIAVDIYLATNGISGDTISEETIAFSTLHPFIPACFGVLTGHLFWPMSAPISYRSLRIKALAVFGCVVLLLDIMGLGPITPMLFILPCIIVGHLLWPQPNKQDAR